MQKRAISSSECEGEGIYERALVRDIRASRDSRAYFFIASSVKKELYISLLLAGYFIILYTKTVPMSIKKARIKAPSRRGLRVSGGGERVTKIIGIRVIFLECISWYG